MNRLPEPYSLHGLAGRSGPNDDDDEQRCEDCDLPEYEGDEPVCTLELCDDGRYRCERCAGEYERTTSEEEE